MEESNDMKHQELLKKFNRYNNGRRKELKRVDVEAVKAGFRQAWRDRDYVSIIAVGRRINEEVLAENPLLHMWIDQAVTRTTY